MPSIHAAAVLPAITWLEEFPLLEHVFEGWPELQPNGQLAPRDVRGHGLVAEKKRTAEVRCGVIGFLRPRWTDRSSPVNAWNIST